MRIAIGSDHAGFELKEAVKVFLIEQKHELLDVGTYFRGNFAVSRITRSAWRAKNFGGVNHNEQE